MTKHIRSLNTRLSRRQIMTGAAGLTFAIAVGAAGRTTAAALAKGTWQSSAKPLGEHRRGRHDHPHVAGDRDGAGIHDLVATDPRRGARCRLAEGAHRTGTTECSDLWQPRLRRSHDVHCRQQRGDRLFPPAAHIRRAGPPRAPQQCGQALGRPGGRADDGTERGGAREVGTRASPTARSPPLPRFLPSRRRSSPRI